MKLDIKTKRKKQGLTQEKLSERAGLSRSYIAAIESDNIEKSPSIETLVAIANALGVRVGDLFDDVLPIAVAGKVGAGAKVPLVDAYEKGDGLYQVACPSELPNPSGTVGVEIEGDSMAPFYCDGDVLFYSRDVIGVPTEAVGVICVCEDKDSNGWLKHVKSGSEPNKFHLISLNPLVNNMFDVELKWAAPIKLYWPKALITKI